MFCKNCGQKVSEKAVFCEKCGAKVVGEGSASPVPVEPSAVPPVCTLTIINQKLPILLRVKGKVFLNGEYQGVLKSGQQSTYTLASPIVDVKISSPSPATLSLKKKLRLESDAYLEFGPKNVFWFLYTIAIKELTGATVLP